MEQKEIVRSCIDCGVINCDHGEKEYPPFCLTTGMDPKVLDRAMERYNEEENGRIMAVAAKVEAENYCKLTRVEETVLFAKTMGYKKVGIACCVGLISEARTLARILRANGLEVYGAACKVGAQPKVSVGIDPSYESCGVNMCNPVLQAELLNEAGTELNIVVGLCVGHDSLFYKHSNAICTTLVAKDRVLAHNTVGALYQTGSYYGRLLDGEE